MQVRFGNPGVQRLLAAAAFVAVVPPVIAQQTPAPSPRPTPPPSVITLPGAERFSLPSSGPQAARPTPAPSPLVVPTLAPTPAAQHTPVAAPTPTPTRAPVARPTPAPTPSVALVLTPTPVATPTPQPTVQPALTSTPVPQTAPAAQPVAQSAPVWPWIALGSAGTLALGAIAWFLLRRRRREEDEEELFEPEPAAVPPPPAPPRPVAPPPSPAPVPPPLTDPIAIEIRPRDLVLNGEDAHLSVELILTNTGPVSADGLRITLALISASPDQDMQSARFHTSSNLQPVAEPFDLAAGQRWAITGRLTLPRATIHAVTVGTRTMFVPLVMVDLRWRGGLSLKRHGADFMVGTGGQGAKLGPIWLDRTRYEALAASRYFARVVETQPG
jgi:hypothetical protein